MISKPRSAHSIDDYCSSELPCPVSAIRYHLPVELHQNGGASGLYHYCCFVYPDQQIIPIGYCAENCRGHRTKQGARKHYLNYLLDRFLQFDGVLASSGACAFCRQTTNHYAWINFHFEWDVVPLCGAHMNRTAFEKVFVLNDYHLLQVSGPQDEAVATVAKVGGPISIVLPRRYRHKGHSSFVTNISAAASSPAKSVYQLPPPCI